MRLAILCTLLLGCGDSGDDPPWDPGDPLPGSCEGATALEATIAGEVFAFDGTTSNATRGSTFMSSPTVVGQPWHTLNILDQIIEVGAVTLPDDQVRLTYSMNPNGSEETENVNVDTEQPVAANWNLAEVDGTVSFEQAGANVGERRCGWIDVTLRWTPVGDGERSVRARGTFDATVEEIIDQ